MRWLAGAFDPSGRASRARLGAALGVEGVSIAEVGPLRVAYTGAQVARRGPLCLLDGFLDNEAELAAALAAPPSCRTEDLLALSWQRWGPLLPARLRGDFALLIWDDDQAAGLLARDQLGVRSLFLHDVNGVLYFANELRCLLGLLPRRPPPDPVGVAHWIAAGGRPGTGTLYAGVRRLSPGGMVLFDGERASERAYWAPRYEEPDVGRSDQADCVRSAIDIAVRRRLHPSGPTGVLMSGGLDSAAVAATAARAAPGRIVAYSGVFPDHPAVDESGLIDRLRDVLRIRGVSAEVRAGGLLASALESQEHWGVPLVGWGEFWALPLLRAAAASGVSHVMGGDGGDELFEVRSYLVADCVRAGRVHDALRLVRRLPGAAYGPSRYQVARVTTNLALLGSLPYGFHNRLRTLLRSRTQHRWLRASTRALMRQSEDPLAWKRLDGPRWWAHIAHVLTRGVEELGVFDSLRRTAMLAGVEMRHPLFDLDLVEGVLRSPPELSFDARLSRPLLRASMVGLLSDEVRTRARKAMFDSLITDSLLARDGAAVRALLGDPRAELAAFVDLGAVESLLLGQNAKRASFGAAQATWRLVTAELWLRAQSDPHAQLLPRGCDVAPASVTISG
jgi:asparagine synthase (glutamine-hydrolysing)